LRITLRIKSPDTPLFRPPASAVRYLSLQPTLADPSWSAETTAGGQASHAANDRTSLARWSPDGVEVGAVVHQGSAGCGRGGSQVGTVNGCKRGLLRTLAELSSISLPVGSRTYELSWRGSLSATYACFMVVKTVSGHRLGPRTLPVLRARWVGVSPVHDFHVPI
jgi:hypothetical protein